MDKYWAQAPERRDQSVLFCPTLDESVPAEHPIRTVDEILALYDWSEWEKKYDGYRGQPPIHPKLMAGVILYGLIRGIRSSRCLEDATRERRDFRWFLEGRTIDHSTFARFRTNFTVELKELNGKIAVMLCDHYEDALVTLILDGTRERANSDRHGTRTADTLERLIGDVAKALNEKLDRMAKADASENVIDIEVDQLRKEVCELQAKVEKYEKALEQARERDATKQKHEGKNAKPVRVPVTDPDSFFQPNKDGGYAPNYTPIVGVDQASGAVVFEDVPVGAVESASVLPAVQEVESMCGSYPKRVLGDGNLFTGETMETLEGMGIEVYTPTDVDFSAANPANRPDPTQPVPQELQGKLPLRNGHFSQAAFVYDSANDHYYCPNGKVLEPIGERTKSTTGVKCKRYKCPGKEGCPLAKQCAQEKADARTVTRDEYQDTRDVVGQRMATDEGRTIYKKRAPVVEGTFAYIKQHMNIRAFLLRGIEKVRLEWTWICTAYNLRLLMKLLSQVSKTQSNGPKQPKGPSNPTQQTQEQLDIFQNNKIRYQGYPKMVLFPVSLPKRPGTMARQRAA